MEKDYLSYQTQPPVPQAPEFADLPPAYTEIDSDPSLDKAQASGFAPGAPFAPMPPFAPVAPIEPTTELVDSKHVPNLPSITDEQARAALMVEAQKKDSNLNKKAIKAMKITKIEYSFMHAYFLQSYTEKRESSWSYTKYSHGRIDDQSFGKMPTVWEFQPPSTQLQPLFHAQTKEFAIPHSEYVQPCHNCSSVNRGCFTCSGNNKLKYYLKVKISFCNWKDCAMEPENGGPLPIPKDQLKNVNGDVIYRQEAKSVKPISYIQNDAISRHSERLIGLHKNHLKTERLIIQRHQVVLIPVITVHYTHENLSGRYFIYGNEKRIHCPDFPHSTCVLM